MAKWKTIKTRYIYQTPFGHLRTDSCELSNGETIDNYYVHEYPDWVNAIVLTKEKQIVLVEQYRHPGNDFYLEIPAGKVEEDESYEEGIIREVQEETGFTSLKKPILLGEFMVNPATQTNKVLTFLILDAFQSSSQNLDENEDVTLKIIPFDHIEQLIEDHKVTQLFTVSAYYLAKNYLSKNEEN
ncbi:NUDIX hydrolase [Fictibacillus phosphorivorans]|uniref:NUDIX hydrolase n=1 Tax=Fictibacillus phosphorivorans TaxID=1221500 RepID=UPI001293ADAD|nr:NUDIX hydrolase [Fictibacillus phosphorivorans]MQR94547.1 NUDIX hydrolase [Fictibacillus phosphorivorans]